MNWIGKYLTYKLYVSYYTLRNGKKNEKSWVKLYVLTAVRTNQLTMIANESRGKIWGPEIVSEPSQTNLFYG